MTNGAHANADRVVVGSNDQIGQKIQHLLDDLGQALREAQVHAGAGVPAVSIDQAVEQIRDQVAQILDAARDQADQIVGHARHTTVGVTNRLDKPPVDHDYLGLEDPWVPRPVSTGPSAVRAAGGPSFDDFGPVDSNETNDRPAAPEITSKGGFAAQLDATDQEWLSALREAINDDRSLEELSDPSGVVSSQETMSIVEARPANETGFGDEIKFGDETGDNDEMAPTGEMAVVELTLDVAEVDLASASPLAEITALADTSVTDHRRFAGSSPRRRWRRSRT